MAWRRWLEVDKGRHRQEERKFGANVFVMHSLLVPVKHLGVEKRLHVRMCCPN